MTDPIEWPNYFFHTDFSEHYTELEQIPLGILSTQHLQELSQILQATDTGVEKDNWNEDVLVGVEVIYNGANASRLPTRFTANMALGLVFPDRETGPTGRVYLVWTTPPI